MKSQQNKHGRLASIAGSKPVLAVGALALTYLAILIACILGGSLG